MKRILYLAYYLRNTNWDRYEKFLNYAVKTSGKNKIGLALDSFLSGFLYNVSPVEYFLFHFYELPTEQRKSWAGTGFMFEYQRKMNPLKYRGILDDKRKFAKEYRHLMRHLVVDDEDLKNQNIEKQLIENSGGKLVFKPFDGKCGVGIRIDKAEDWKNKSLATYLENSEFGLIEEFIVQHDELNRLSPAGVNTIRIITQLDHQDDVVILGARLRITVNSFVDNLAAGNIAAEIDLESGKVTRAAVYSDITKAPESNHPITKVEIIGFQIPFWQECLQLAREAAMLHSENRSIGWDIVVTNDGPGLIEGNHDWCKLLWQLPVEHGLKSTLLQYV